MFRETQVEMSKDGIATAIGLSIAGEGNHVSSFVFKAELHFITQNLGTC